MFTNSHNSSRRWPTSVIHAALNIKNIANVHQHKFDHDEPRFVMRLLIQEQICKIAKTIPWASKLELMLLTLPGNQKTLPPPRCRPLALFKHRTGTSLHSFCIAGTSVPPTLLPRPSPLWHKKCSLGIWHKIDKYQSSLNLVRKSISTMERFLI